MNPATQRWFRRPAAARRARWRLFCFPYAGGRSTVFSPWVRLLPDDVEPVFACLPGREDRVQEPPARTMESLLEGLLPAVVPLLDVPFALFGHSMGARLAFELALELRRAGAPAPIHLFVAACRAPDVPARVGRTEALSDAQLVDRLQRLGGIPAGADLGSELMAQLLPIFRADLRLFESCAHRRDPPIGCPITALGGREDQAVPAADLDAWREQTTGRFSLQLLPGGHLFINTERDELIRRVLEEVRASGVLYS